MLKSTFVHIPGVGYALEQRIWAAGIKTWDDYIKKLDQVPLSIKKKGNIFMNKCVFLMKI